MRILWASNAPWASTGYGNQTAIMTPQLQAMGHEVAIFAYYGLDGAILDWNGMRVYPGGLLHWGNDMIRGHAKHWKADVVISLMDVWVQEYWGRRLHEEGMLFAPWTPIDQAPVPQRIIDRLDGADVTIAMSHFGKSELHKAGVTGTAYVPHLVDTSVYQPLDQAECRQALKLPTDKFIVGVVAANTGRRKAFPEQIRAFAILHERHPDTVLYMHTIAESWERGVDLIGLARNQGLEIGKDIIFPDAYNVILGYPTERMVELYNSFDVLSAATMGEGFGIPILEAQACGIPVVVSDNTTGPELAFAGCVVKRMHPYWTDLNGWASLPDVHDLAMQYERVYRLRGGKSEDARRGACQYDVKRAATYWEPVLNHLQELQDGRH